MSPAPSTPASSRPLPTITHVRASGRYDRPDSTFINALHLYMRDADVISLSEVGSPERRAAIKDALDGTSWRAFHPSPKDPGPGEDRQTVDESAILWDNHALRLRHASSLLLTSHPIPARPHPLYAVAAVFSTVTEDSTRVPRFAISATHLPSDVQDNMFDAHPIDSNVVAWRDATQNWPREFHRFAHRNRASIRLVNADWNVNIRQKRYRELVNEVFPTMHLTLPTPLPSKGTHGPRLIDFSYTNAQVVSPAQIMPENPSSDHKPYTETIALHRAHAD